MRRRQIFAMQSNALNEPRKEVILEEAKRETTAEEVLKARACPTCGKIVGRGMAMHMKHCKGL